MIKIWLASLFLLCEHSLGQSLAADCRDDSHECLEKIYVTACAALNDVERDSCRVTCRLCQEANCVDTLETEQCILLIRKHATQPCKKLNFKERFDCRATCSICLEEPRVFLKGIRNLHELEDPSQNSTFIVPDKPSLPQSPSTTHSSYALNASNNITLKSNMCMVTSVIILLLMVKKMMKNLSRD